MVNFYGVAFAIVGWKKSSQARIFAAAEQGRAAVGV
jgi:hypothetical protein